MKATTAWMSLVIFGLAANVLQAEKFGTDLPAGPEIGTKITKFDTTGIASKRHLCWSCYG